MTTGWHRTRYSTPGVAHVSMWRGSAPRVVSATEWAVGYGPAYTQRETAGIVVTVTNALVNVAASYSPKGPGDTYGVHWDAYNGLVGLDPEPIFSEQIALSVIDPLGPVPSGYLSFQGPVSLTIYVHGSEGDDLVRDLFHDQDNLQLAYHAPDIQPDPTGFIAGWHGTGAFGHLILSNQLVAGGNEGTAKWARLYSGRQKVRRIYLDVIRGPDPGGAGEIMGIGARMSGVPGNSDAGWDGICFYTQVWDNAKVRLSWGRYANAVQVEGDYQFELQHPWARGTAKRMQMDFTDGVGLKTVKLYLADAGTGANAVLVRTVTLSASLEDAAHVYAGLVFTHYSYCAYGTEFGVVTPRLVADPPEVEWTITKGKSPPDPVDVSLIALPADFPVGGIATEIIYDQGWAGAWLVANAEGTDAPTTMPVVAQALVSNLPAGDYTATVRVTSDAATVEVPVVLHIVAPPGDPDGFACYLPGRRCILFVFGSRVYVLSLWDAKALKWTYGELGFEAQSGGVLYAGLETPSMPPTGEASDVALTVTSDTGIQVSWKNNGLTGGEVAEVWLHATTADTWTLGAQVRTSGGGQATDLVTAAGTTYEAQVRYRRGPYYRLDYASDDASAWPSGSLSNTVTTTLATPVVTTAWKRVSATVEQIVLHWTGNTSVKSLITRDSILIATIPAGTTPPSPTSGLVTAPTFSLGTTDDNVAYTGCDYLINGSPYTLVASMPEGDALPGTIPVWKCGAYIAVADPYGTVTYLPAPASFSPGYPTEAAALAAVPPVPTGQVLLATISRQVTATTTLTKFYVPATITPLGPLSYVDDALPSGEAQYTYVVTQEADISAASADAIQWAGPTPLVTSFDSLVTCIGHHYIAAWTTPNPDAVQVRHMLNGGPVVEDGRTIEASFAADVAGAVAGDALMVYLRHVETAFGVDDFSEERSSRATISAGACP